jgi:hypothetical protein
VVIDAVTAATAIDANILRNLRLSDLQEIIQAVLTVNADFFVRRLPLMKATVQAMFGSALGDGPTSSPTSPAAASSARKH